MIKILFICHGNICRSTMSEYVMKRMWTGDGDFLAVSSSEIYIPHQIQNKAMGVDRDFALILPEVLKNLKQF